MDNKQLSPRTLGIELDGDRLRACLVAAERDRFCVEGRWEIPLSECTGTDLLTLLAERQAGGLEADHTNLRTLRQALSVTAAPSRDVLLRPLDLALTKDSDISAVVAFEAEPLLPYPANEATLDFLRQGGTPEKKGALTIFSIRNERLTAHLESCSEAGVEPEQVSCLPAALATFTRHAIPGDAPVVTIHVDAQETTCVLIDSGQLVSSFAIASGIDELIEALSDDLNTSAADARQALYDDIDLAKVKKAAHPELTATTKRYLQEISRTVYALKKAFSGSTDALQVFVTGPGAALSSLPAAIAKGSALPAATPRASESWGIAAEELPLWAGALGLALGALQLPEASTATILNFRQGDNAYPHPWKRLARPLAIYGGLCIAIAALIYGSSLAWSARETAHLRNSYHRAVIALEQTVSQVEAQYRERERLPAATGNERQILAQLSRNEIESRVSFLEKQLQGSGAIFALDPKTPRVSDLLAWLATHPQVVATDADGVTTPLLTIQTIDYSMVKRPDKTRLKDKYRIKVDLELTSESPREARMFHDALIAPNSMIDPKSEVKWSASHGRYRASFFLKDKTRYTVGG